MGGCRCYFRQCHVSNAKFPRMHFFRFPLKELDRYKKWRLYSKMEHMLEFSEVRRRNTSICARHFRTECFMNYKMDRLVPNAVPTIIRLSYDQALDFELDIENGVLVTLEKTKFEHLIPPDTFECPLSLINDKILIEKLNQLQIQQCCTNNFLQEDEYVASEKNTEYEEVILGEPKKYLVNSVEILESIQVKSANSKRQRKLDEMEIAVTSANVSSKKCRILNTGETNTKDGSFIVLTTRPLQLQNCNANSNEFDIAEIEQMENAKEPLHEESLHLSSKAFINDDDLENTEDIEFIEIHEDENSLPYELPINEHLKSGKQVESSTIESENEEFSKLNDQLMEYKEKSKDFDILQVKLSVLEAENKDLKKVCKENEKMSKQLLSLQIKNNYIKKTVKDYEILNDKLREYCEENNKLKEDKASNQILRAELSSRKQEIKDLKKKLEILKSSQSKEQDIKKQFGLDTDNERINYIAKERKMNEELTILIKKLELSQQKLKDTESELIEVKTKLTEMTNENEILNQQQKDLEQSLNNIQNNLDLKQNECCILKSDYEILQQKHSTLEKKCWKLQALKSQEATVSTSFENAVSKLNLTATAPTLTKAQLFSSIKRYLSAAMVSLLRMEMFSSSEREWKSDERQVAVDILRLGETVYKYFTDEWRFRLPALRDVRVWLNKSEEIIDDEDI